MSAGNVGKVVTYTCSSKADGGQRTVKILAWVKAGDSMDATRQYLLVPKRQDGGPDCADTSQFHRYLVQEDRRTPAGRVLKTKWYAPIASVIDSALRSSVGAAVEPKVAEMPPEPKTRTGTVDVEKIEANATSIILWLKNAAAVAPAIPGGTDGCLRTAGFIQTLLSTIRHLKDREESIIAACDKVADGGQYRADIVSAISGMRKERDQLRLAHTEAVGLLKELRGDVSDESFLARMDAVIGNAP